MYEWNIRRVICEVSYLRGKFFVNQKIKINKIKQGHEFNIINYNYRGLFYFNIKKT